MVTEIDSVERRVSLDVHEEGPTEGVQGEDEGVESRVHLLSETH